MQRRGRAESEALSVRSELSGRDRSHTLSSTNKMGFRDIMIWSKFTRNLRDKVKAKKEEKKVSCVRTETAAGDILPCNHRALQRSDWARKTGQVKKTSLCMHYNKV